MKNYMGKKITEKNPRYERKFIIPELECPKIKYLIQHHPAMFLKTFHKRHINNIYLDSIVLGNYQDNLAGNSQRLKIRIRWYGKTFGLIENPILEIKTKKETLGQKKYFKLKSFTLDKDFSLKLLHKEVFEKSNLPKWIMEKLKFSQNVLLTSYEREYFQSADKKYRITIDKNLEFFKVKNQNNNFIEKISYNNQILELKYSEEDDGTASEITKFFPFRITAYSKYVYGVDVLDL